MATAKTGQIDNSGGVYSMEIMDLYRERIDPNDGQPVDGKFKKHVSITTMDSNGC